MATGSGDKHFATAPNLEAWLDKYPTRGHSLLGCRHIKRRHKNDSPIEKALRRARTRRADELVRRVIKGVRSGKLLPKAPDEDADWWRGSVKA